MALGRDHPITDVCMLVADLDRSITFYEKPLRTTSASKIVVLRAARR